MVPQRKNKEIKCKICGKYFFDGVWEQCGLMQIGLRIKTVRNKAIVYHLHHPVWYSEDTVMDNFKKLNTKKDKNQVVCLNGLTKSNVTKAT